MYIFGPVPSRRLGKSMGINIIPPKHCSYSCVYCQLGRTEKMQITPVKMNDIDGLKKELEEKLTALESKGEKVDYLTFVADGEPTLASGMDHLIDEIKVYGIDTAVITNSTLLWKDEVREGLLQADWVSLKCDSVVESTWKKIDRPHGRLDLEVIKEGMLDFAEEYKGELATETMLIKNMNDSRSEIEKIIEFIKRLSPDKSYLSIPTRPPAEDNVHPASYEFITTAYNLFDEAGIDTEHLIGYEGNEFSNSGDIEKDILSITAVHPLKEEAVEELLRRDKGDWSDIDALIEKGRLIEVEFEDNKYYIRKTG